MPQYFYRFISNGAVCEDGAAAVLGPALRRSGLDRSSRSGLAAAPCSGCAEGRRQQGRALPLLGRSAAANGLLWSWREVIGQARRLLAATGALLCEAADEREYSRAAEPPAGCQSDITAEFAGIKGIPYANQRRKVLFMGNKGILVL